MTHEELISIYKKTERVINSCETIAHLYTAQKYAQLFVNQLPLAWHKLTVTNLNTLISKKKKFIIRTRHS